MCYRRRVKRIGVRELRQHASRFLDDVKAGESVEISERGQLIAMLVPPSAAVAARDRLVASGRLTPARAAFVLPRRRVIAVGEVAASHALDELRRERLR